MPLAVHVHTSEGQNDVAFTKMVWERGVLMLKKSRENFRKFIRRLVWWQPVLFVLLMFAIGLYANNQNKKNDVISVQESILDTIAMSSAAMEDSAQESQIASTQDGELDEWESAEQEGGEWSSSEEWQELESALNDQTWSDANFSEYADAESGDSSENNTYESDLYESGSYESDSTDHHSQANEVTKSSAKDKNAKNGTTRETDAQNTGANVEVVSQNGIAIKESGTYNTKDEVALYIRTFGKLPSNYITKSKAEDRGWNPHSGNLAKALPGMSIGGNYFGNREGSLPEKKGRKYYECDIDYTSGFRNEKRIVYSNDGLIFYTEDHYETFEQLY